MVLKALEEGTEKEEVVQVPETEVIEEIYKETDLKIERVVKKVKKMIERILELQVENLKGELKMVDVETMIDFLTVIEGGVMIDSLMDHLSVETMIVEEEEEMKIEGMIGMEDLMIRRMTEGDRKVEERIGLRTEEMTEFKIRSEMMTNRKEERGTGMRVKEEVVLQVEEEVVRETEGQQMTVKTVREEQN